MNLFSVKSNKTGKVIKLTDGFAFFGNKQEAKTFRDNLNKGIPTTYYVSRGPDHRNYTGR